MKRLICLLLCLTVILSVTVIAFADDKTNEHQQILINEYEYLETLSTMTDEELNKEGLSRESVDLLLSKYISTLKNRTTLPYEKLLALDYTEEQCKILHELNFEDEIQRDLLYATAATLTGYVTSNSIINNNFTLSFTWQWSSAPIMCLTDICAIRWAAFDYNGYYIDSDASAKNMDVYYSYNGNYYSLRHGTLNENEDFYYVSYTFPLEILIPESYDEASGTCDSAYAKMGRMTLTITSRNVNNNPIGHIKFRAAYGHKTIVILNPSVTITPGSTGSFGFSFSGLGSNNNELFGKNYKLNLNGTIEEL